MTRKGIRAKANTRGQCVPSLGSDVMKKLGMIWMDKNMKDKAHRGWQTSGGNCHSSIAVVVSIIESW